jgi:ferrous iron transport protein B
MTHRRIYIAGNPNSGKSTLFNALSGLHHKTANFPGVTVESLRSSIDLGNGILADLVDLPGTYSLYPQSEDEKVTCREIIRASVDSRENTLILLVLDAANLFRSMLLIRQIRDLNLPLLVVLNKADRVSSPGLRGVIRWFLQELGLCAIAADARKGRGVQEIQKAMRKPCAIYASVNRAEASSPADQWMQMYDAPATVSPSHQAEIRRAHSKETVEHYSRIAAQLKSCPMHETKAKIALPNPIDRVLLHPVWGYGIFVLVMLLMFQALFAWASYPMDGIESIMLWAADCAQQALQEEHPGWTRFLVQGLIPGISGVLVFVPQIFLLFFFLVVLEESGYMSRVSYLMDHGLKSIGLNGKSIVPMIGGFACAVPSITATRNIVSWKERIATIMILPLMSCSARLPVYALLVQFAVPGGYWLGIFSLQGLAMMGLYLLGVVAAVGSAIAMKYWIKPKGPSYFMFEIVPYQWPVSRNLWQVPVRYCVNFVKGAGKVIVLVSVGLWALSSFGPGNNWSATLQGKEETPPLEHSYAGVLGKGIEPIVEPLGFDWKIGIALVTSFAAREVFVGTMATIYGLEGDPEDIQTGKRLKERMAGDLKAGTNQPLFDTATVWSLLVFYVFALQCMSTIATTRMETKSWKWPMIQLAYLSFLAYAGSFLVYRICLLI